MKVFIGWSGPRSQALAKALHDWIPLVLHYAKPWLSEKDIDAGERWAEAIAKELEASNFGIMCITRDNVSNQWILFEAGSLAKSLQMSRVIPLLLDLDISEISGPLAQFQAKKAEKAGLEEVITSINQAATEPVAPERAKQLFDALWPEFEKRLATFPEPAPSAKRTRPQTEILEELVAGVRSLDSRLRSVEVISSEVNRFSRDKRRVVSDPFMIHELSRMLSDKPDDPIQLLIVASALRDEIPWLHELVTEAYKSAKAGSPKEVRAVMRKLRRAVSILLESPALEESGVDPRWLHTILHDLERITLREEGNVGPSPSPIEWKEEKDTKES